MFYCVLSNDYCLYIIESGAPYLVFLCCFGACLLSYCKTNLSTVTDKVTWSLAAEHIRLYQTHFKPLKEGTHWTKPGLIRQNGDFLTHDYVGRLYLCFLMTAKLKTLMIELFLRCFHTKPLQFWFLLYIYTTEQHRKEIQDYSILFHSILFHSIPFYSIPFHSIPFHSILFYSILFYSILLYSILFYSIPFYSNPFYSILFYSILFYSIPFYSILNSKYIIYFFKRG